MDLRQADRIRERDPDAAFAAYRSHVDELDPRRPEDAERALFLLLRLRGPDPALDTLASRAAETGAEPELRAQANRIAALFAIGRRDYSGAYERLRASLHHLAGRGDRTEWVTCINLARIALVEGREFEALVMSRRAERILREVGNALWLLSSRLHLLSCLVELEDWPRFDALLAILEERLSDIPEQDRARFEGLVLARTAAAALLRGDGEAALHHHDRKKALEGEPIGPGDAAVRACFLALGGDAGGALEQFRLARRMGRPDSIARWRLAFAKTFAELALDPERGVRHARRFVRALGRTPRSHLGAGRRAEMASRIGYLLRDLGQVRETARLCFDVSGAALLERLFELEAFGREFPDLVRLEEEDRKILRDYRARLLARQREVLDSVGGLFEEAVGTADSPAPLFRTGEGLLRVCAWCSRVNARDGEWMPIRHLLPPRDRVEVTHGMCPDCARASSPAR